MQSAPTHLSLFSGIGGLDMAAEWAGFRTVGQCEWADYPTKVLQKHWPNVPRWRDIRTLTGDDFYRETGLRTVDIISGGFPCQPFSAAGKQKGESDNRFMWQEMLRVIKALHPSWVLGENVDGLLAEKFDGTLRDIVGGLEKAGYYVRVFSFEAAQVGSWQRRRRTFIVAHTLRGRHVHGKPQELATKAGKSAQRESFQCGETLGNAERGRCNRDDGWRTRPEPAYRCKIVPNAENAERARCIADGNQTGIAGLADGGRRSAESGLGRVVDGVPYWLDEPAGVPRIARGVKDRVGRIKGLGNAVVPQQAYQIFAAIYEILEVL